MAIVLLGCTNLVWSACLESGFQVQVLGSGGPHSSEGRALSGYIVWIDGVSRVMVDAGSGTKDHFHASGASLDDIDLIALSHLHPDHSAELPAILWPRSGDHRVSGPTGAGAFPSISAFLDRVFGENGAYPVFANSVNFEVITIDTSKPDVVDVWGEDDISVTGVRVPHGIVPAIGYRVQVGDKSVVFASDQNGSDEAFVDFIRGADVLVIHMALSEGARPRAISWGNLHAKPSVWAQMAQQAGVGQVLVSHIGVVNALESDLKVLQGIYKGPVTVAEDMTCLAVN
jgi:ribonuclease BN (tRNA processing enzyme)